MSKSFLTDYHNLTDPDDWFAQVRLAAERNGFAPSVRDYKRSPEEYVGSIREASQVIRVLMTGSTISHSMHLVANALGEHEVRRRIGAVVGYE